MKIKKNDIEYEVVFKLSSDIPKSPSNVLNEWIKLIKEEELKKKKKKNKLRVKKLNRLNKKREN